ncbi:MAG: hypothetical protein ACI4C5_07050 [Lachnospiraceae bacterium]
MDLEKRVELQNEETRKALQILLGYAKKTAGPDLNRNRDKIEQLKKFSMNMACFFCVEGHERDCDSRIMEKYVQPYDRMLKGDKNALSRVEYDNISQDNMEMFLSAINRYKQEMQDDYSPAYDEDMDFCDSIVQEVMHQYSQESDVSHQIITEKNAAQAQENGLPKEDIADGNVEENQLNGPSLHGM